VSSAPTRDSFAWIVATSREDVPVLELGIGALRFGIRTEERSFDQWFLCTGGTQDPQDGWPDSGTGITVTWPDDCYVPEGGSAVVGFLTLSRAPGGWYEIGKDPRIDDAEVTFCDGAPYGLLGAAHRQELVRGDLTDPTIDCQVHADPVGKPVCVPPPVPARSSTWGTVKALYTTGS